MFLETPPKTRSRFFLLRLGLTALFLLVLLGVASLDWYPGLLLQLSGTTRHLAVAACVALVIGPGLSTFLYRPGKRRLLFDLLFVLAIEVAVIAFIAHDLYERRPYFAVFAVDRFELVAANEVDWGDIRQDELRSKPFGSPRLVYAKLPEDPAAITTLIEEVVLGGAPDIDRRPEFWLPYSEGAQTVRESLISLENTSNAAAMIEDWLNSDALDALNFGYLPLRGPTGDASIIISRASGMPVDILDFDPW